jgi:ferrous iron transport protein B
MKKITVALAGNPNCGKTSIFNMLTGARQHVGNYPGVTVEKKQGTAQHGDYELTFVDLPGTYSLTAYSVEELVARNFIIDDKPDVVVDIIDSSNLERHLYLATQFMELNVPLVLAFNMTDVAMRKGLVFDTKQLSRLLGAHIVRTIGSKQKGKVALVDAIIETAESAKAEPAHTVGYGQEIEDELAKIERLIAENEKALVAKYPVRWLAVKLLEGDREIKGKVSSSELLEGVTASTDHLRGIFRDEPEIVMADRRYGYLSG